MNNLLSEMDKSFEEKFGKELPMYFEKKGDTNILYPIDAHKRFLHQAVKRAYEEGKKEVMLDLLVKSGLEHKEIVSLFNKEG